MDKERKRFDFTKDLQKNDRFSFTKDGDEGYNKIQVDLSWSLKGINSHGLTGLDLDACAFLVGEDGVINDDADFVYYKSGSRWMPSDSRWMDKEQREVADVTEGDFAPFDRKIFKTGKKWRLETLPVSKDASVFGSWDDLGEGEDGEDDEESGEKMHVVLDRVGEDIAEIIFCVSIYPNPEYGPVEKQTFDKVSDAKIEITDEETGNILCSYKLNEEFNGKTAVEVGKLSLNDEGEWEFVALGEGHEGGMQTLVDIYA